MTYTAVYWDVTVGQCSRTIQFEAPHDRKQAWINAAAEEMGREILICIIPGRQEVWSPEFQID